LASGDEQNKRVLGKKKFRSRREEAVEGWTSLNEMGGAYGIHGQKTNAFRAFGGENT
jgi:hypothetical protein